MKKFNVKSKNANTKNDDSKRQIPKDFDFEQLTTQLIEETIGVDGVLQIKLNNLLENFHKEKNPLSVEEAKKMFYSLILSAISQRRLLAGRIAQSISHGDIFKQYKEKMKEIDKVTADTQIKMKKMQAARKQYEFHYHIYEKVTGKTYTPDSTPDPTPNPGYQSNPHDPEAWTGFEKESGSHDDRGDNIVQTGKIKLNENQAAPKSQMEFEVSAQKEKPK